MDSKYATRLFFGTIMVVMLAAGLFFEGYICAKGYWCFSNAANIGLGFGVFVLAVSILCVLELRKLTEGCGIKLFRFPAITGLCLISALPFYKQNPHENMYVAIFVMLVFLLSAIWQAKIYKSAGAIANIAGTVFGFIYIGFGGYFLIQLRLFDFYSDTFALQSGYIITFVAVVKGTDIGAYLVGRKYGKSKIIPSISPGKSWEGLFAGLIFSAAIAVGLGTYGFSLLSVTEAIIFGSVLAVYGQFGDLVESMLKRDAGLKDSASLIPEFGGFLDLIDSPFFAAPLGWVLFQGMCSAGGWRSLLV